ncbi:MAG: OmpA family protein [Myxococcales bacterium]|nr:OmpA family protein [Myxococcales bacterium]
MRLGRLLATACAASAATFLLGCPPIYPNCNSDEHCKEHGEVCVQGQCQECATDEQCKAGFTCEGNKCVPKPECRTDAECGPGKKCTAGKCVEAPVAGKPPGCTADEDCPSGEECRAGQCVAKVEAPCEYSPIRFEFNEHKLTGEAQGVLGRLADCIKKQKARLTLEGHADERGTEEYNLQLSNKRAASVRRYLVDLGVASSQLETVGYGENRPATSGANEESWAANRRVEFAKR